MSMSTISQSLMQLEPGYRLIDLFDQTVADIVATYNTYRSQHRAKGLDDGKMCNGELEVDEYLTANLHLVWYGHFYSMFPPHWQFDPTPPADKTERALKLTEKAKVRYVCQECGHTWTSVNGSVQFWALSQHRLHFNLPGADCSLCDARHQPALWYPDEVIRVINFCYAFLQGGEPSRKAVETALTYRRGCTFHEPVEEEELDLSTAVVDSTDWPVDIVVVKDGQMALENDDTRSRSSICSDDNNSARSIVSTSSRGSSDRNGKTNTIYLMLPPGDSSLWRDRSSSMTSVDSGLLCDHSS